MPTITIDPNNPDDLRWIRELLAQTSANEPEATEPTPVTSPHGQSQVWQTAHDYMATQVTAARQAHVLDYLTAASQRSTVVPVTQPNSARVKLVAQDNRPLPNIGYVYKSGLVNFRLPLETADQHERATLLNSAFARSLELAVSVRLTDSDAVDTAIKLLDQSIEYKPDQLDR